MLCALETRTVVVDVMHFNNRAKISTDQRAPLHLGRQCLGSNDI